MPHGEGFRKISLALVLREHSFFAFSCLMRHPFLKDFEKQYFSIDAVGYNSRCAVKNAALKNMAALFPRTIYRNRFLCEFCAALAPGKVNIVPETLILCIHLSKPG